jgi:ATP synthase protein I
LVDSEVKVMLNRVTIFDFIVGFVITTILYFTYREFAGLFLIGLTVAVFNFIIGGIITESLLSKNKGPGIFFMFIKIFRTLLICGVPFIFYRDNMYGVLSYMLGFTSHFIALLLYVLFNKSSH